MHIELEKKISVAFDTNQYLYYKGILLNENETVFVATKDIEKGDFEHRTHWTELLHKNSELLDEIVLWHENKTAFQYLFPAVLISCIRNEFINNDELMCLMDKVSPSFFNYGDCSYFYELSKLTKKQRDAFDSFLKELNKKNPDFRDSCQSANKAIAWLNAKDIMIKSIRDNFSNHDKLNYENIADEHDRDGKELCQKLNNIQWTELGKNDGELLKEIIEDYPLLSDQAFFYFMPACMIMTLNHLFDESCEIPFHTINNLCYINNKNKENSVLSHKYKYFSLSQKKIVKEYIELILTTGESERFDRKKISLSLNDYWK